MKKTDGKNTHVLAYTVLLFPHREERCLKQEQKVGGIKHTGKKMETHTRTQTQIYCREYFIIFLHLKISDKKKNRVCIHILFMLVLRYESIEKR